MQDVFESQVRVFYHFFSKNFWIEMSFLMESHPYRASRPF